MKKSTREYKFTHLVQPPTLAAATIFCVWGRTVDIITHANFQVNRFRGFGVSGAENDPPPLTWHIGLNSVRTNVLH